jgi:predicted histidine transporter YuiF (NhaC family)
MRRVLSVDIAIAVAVAVVVLIISPGYAISGLLAIIVLLICGVSLLRERRATTRRGRRMSPPRSRGSARPRPRPPAR